MATWREWICRLWGTLRRNPLDSDLEDELRLHLDLVSEDLQRHGASPDQAQRAARLQAGGLAQTLEALRDQRGLPWLDDFARDLCHALRMLRRSPVFTAITLVILALGIGANTAIFSLVNGMILRPLKYPEPNQLMYVNTGLQGPGNTELPRDPARGGGVSPPEYLEFQEINRSFADVGAFTTGEVNLTAGARAQRVRSAFVDERLLNVLGIQPAHGRLFTTGETDASGPLPPAIAILSHELWQGAFGEQSVVGQPVEIDGRLHEVIGIMPPGVDITDHRPEVWLPLGLNRSNRLNRATHTLEVVGRLKDGVTMQAARTELDALVANWGERVGVQQGPGASGHLLTPLRGAGGHPLQMRALKDHVLGEASREIWLLQAAVGVVLLIACANLASLLLARTESRRHELIMRKALGASHNRLLRQFMTEGVLLSMAGGILGLWLARVGVQVLILVYPASLPRTSDVTVDWFVSLFTFGVATLTGAFFGLAPIMYTRVESLATALHESGFQGGTVPARHYFRHGLVMAEVALAVMLAVGAALLVRTVYNLTQVDAGFDRSRLTTFSMTLPQANYPLPSTRVQLYGRLLAALRAAPGVEAATAMSGLPPRFSAVAAATDVDNYSAPPEGPFEVVDYYQYVMADYFETMGVPVIAGRTFEQRDIASSALVAIVNERLVNTFFRGKDPIGQRFRRCLRCDDDDPWFTVVGVARDVKHGGLDRDTRTEVYIFAKQASMRRPINLVPGTMNVVLRSALPPSALSATILAAVEQVDPSVPVVRLQDMDTVFAESIGRPRLLAELAGAFAGLALLLAVVGTYGVLSYVVAQRRREIGIRLALGAARSRVLAQVMKQGLLVTAIGVVVGLAGALAVNRLIASLLFGVEPTDVPTLAVVVATITLVAGVACGFPAWRASRLDPNVVLREQ